MIDSLPGAGANDRPLRGRRAPCTREVAATFRERSTDASSIFESGLPGLTVATCSSARSSPSGRWRPAMRILELITRRYVLPHVARCSSERRRASSIRLDLRARQQRVGPPPRSCTRRSLTDRDRSGSMASMPGAFSLAVSRLLDRRSSGSRCSPYHRDGVGRRTFRGRW